MKDNEIVFYKNFAFYRKKQENIRKKHGIDLIALLDFWEIIDTGTHEHEPYTGQKYFILKYQDDIYKIPYRIFDGIIYIATAYRQSRLKKFYPSHF